MPFYNVAAKTPFNNSILTYESDQDYRIGDLVEVPLGKRSIGAIILNELSEDEVNRDFEIKKINKKIFSEFNLENSLDLLSWMAQYYHYPLGLLVFDILPKELKRPRELNRIIADQFSEIPLTDLQKEIYQDISSRIKNSGFVKSLLHGVTGSGKTHIYKSLIADTLKFGKSVVFLLPEINLTPQFIDDFKSSFEADIYLYNSELSNSDRFGLWLKLQADKAPKIIIGVRSSIFLPVENLGLIIVDEEHDNSFKQEDRCTYNARDVALKKASLLKIPIVLGSATPTVETYYNFKNKEGYYALKDRVHDVTLPEIHLISEKERTDQEYETWPLKEESITAIKESLDRGEKAIVFINRLGYSSLLQCQACGKSFDCPNCTVGLKFFKKENSLKCNHCDYVETRPEVCPECGCLDLIPKGFGTEKVCEVLEDVFTDKVIGRFDRDHIKNFKQLSKVMHDFKEGSTDVLVGTQMISKGHNFKDVNCVVVLGTDSMLNFPDFRSHERVYQGLTQVAGRSGRYSKNGIVLVQTFDTQQSVYQLVKNHSFDEFYQVETTFRETCQSPPFRKLAMLYISSSQRNLLINECEKLQKISTGLTHKHFSSVRVLGPRPANVEKKVNKFTWSFLFDSTNLNELHNFINSLYDNYNIPSKISLKLDIDPMIIG